MAAAMIAFVQYDQTGKSGSCAGKYPAARLQLTSPNTISHDTWIRSGIPKR